MEWPSKNIPQGGILHPAKAKYSPETHQFLKVLMEESKLSMMQRKQINYALRNGDPLPNPGCNHKRSKTKIPEVTIRPGTSRRKSREEIISSGAYERDVFRCNQPAMDREKEKDRLASKMAYNEDITKPKKTIKKIEDKEADEEPNRFDQLVEEIREREQWLKEMEELGHADKYRLIIEQQIQEKVREMEKLKPTDDQDK